MGVLDDLRQFLGGGDPEATGMAYASSQPSPDLLQYAQDMLSGKIAAGGALGQNYYDPNRSFAANALDPRAIENATDVAFGIGPGAIRAWHASPYDFNKFDISKVGSGQGAQSYGHGIYAAESPAVSGKGGQYDLEFTAKNLGKYDLNPGELQIHRMLRADRSDMDILGELARGGGYTFDEALAALERVKGAKAKIYEVDIHADPKALLDWDRPLSEQGQRVRDIIAGRTDWTTPDMPGGSVYDRLALGGADPRAPGTAWKAREGAPGASETLREAGIPGIRYLDQGSRGVGDPVALQRQIDFAKRFADDTDLLARDRVGWQQRVAELEADLAHAKANPPTSNYAIFDPSIIEILRKYGILPPAVAAGGLLGAGSEPPT